MERSYMCNDEVKNNEGSGKWSTENEDQSCRLAWLPKKYGCSFCKRDFKSAQALGGHMNVHRRDRARLRQLHSWVLGSRKPNPNPNFTSSSFLSPSTEPSPYPAHTGKSFLTPPLACFSSLASVASTYQGKIQLPEYPQTHALATRKQKTVIADHGAGELVAADHAENDIEMGFEDSKKLLDLELRL